MRIHSSFYTRDRPQYNSQKTNINDQVQTSFLFLSLGLPTWLSADSSFIINGISEQNGYTRVATPRA